jgi:hypothetical protein
MLNANRGWLFNIFVVLLVFLSFVPVGVGHALLSGLLAILFIRHSKTYYDVSSSTQQNLLKYYGIDCCSVCLVVYSSVGWRLNRD